MPACGVRLPTSNSSLIVHRSSFIICHLSFPIWYLLFVAPCYNPPMFLTHLALINFRNYARLTLDLPRGPIVVRGDNAQGKTNLLEAVFFLATTRSTFTRAERQIVNWQVLEQEPFPYARLEARVRRGESAFQIDITLLCDESGHLHKEMRLNGVKKRALDLVGQLNAVLFLPEDIDLVTGQPALRRRYLDITLCQIDRAYCRALSQYNQALAQRNALLKQLAERRRGEDQLVFWDEQLAEHGATLIVARRDAVGELDRLGRERYRMLSGDHETLRLYYAPSLDPENRPAPDYQRPLGLEELWSAEPAALSPAEMRLAFVSRIGQLRRDEIARGMTIVGPHRDEVHFLVDGVDMTLYGSRGQQRCTAVALKLAEMDLMSHATGDTPVLLLDDVMSELDSARRTRVMAAVQDVQQLILTTTDWNDYSAEFLAHAHRLQVAAGQVSQVDL
jgi:DNA replication and repair protein RecF